MKEKYYFLTGDPIDSAVLLDAINAGTIGNAESVSSLDILTDLTGCHIRTQNFCAYFSNGKIFGLSVFNKHARAGLEFWAESKGAKLYPYNSYGFREHLSKNVLERCWSCGVVMHGNLFCGDCGAFNVIKTETKRRIGTLANKNPLLSICSDKVIHKTTDGMSIEDALSLRYELSSALGDSVFSESAEREFSEKVLPLFQSGVAGEKFVRLWINYWKNIDGSLSGIRSKNIELQECGNISFKPIYNKLSTIFEKKLSFAISSVQMCSDSIDPILACGISIETLLNDIANIEASLEYAACVAKYIDAVMFDYVSEFEIPSPSCQDWYGTYHHIFRLEKGVSLIEKDSETNRSVFASHESHEVGYFCVRLEAFINDLYALLDCPDIFNISIRDWLLIKFSCFNKALEASGLKSIGAERAFFSGAFKDVESKIDYIDELSRRFKETAEMVMALEEKAENAVNEIESTIEEIENEKLSRRMDKERRQELIENAFREERAEKRARERDHREAMRMMTEMQDRFLTKQVALRQKAQGNYFLSKFTESFGADAGTYLEGF